MLACVFVIELIGASARSQVTAPARSLVVGARTVTLLGVSGPATDRLLSRVAANIGVAVDAVEAFWGVDWSPDISVLAAATDEQFRAAAGVGPASQWVDIAAVTVVDRVDPARRVAVGQRIVFAPGAANISDPALRIVLAHELFHYAARTDTATDAPRWLTEGVADFVARPYAPHILESADARSAAQMLPSDTDLDTPGRQRASAYDRAWWFARFVADTFGTAKLRAFYLAACGVGHADPLVAAREVLGTDSAALLANWQHWLTR
ncbi:DUF4157 domain-containing protein [Mycobacterium haemophilum]|uniref:DUF4157 domain-containing protein n=1 Tax=Mycobacterium haemophilum TaxID=29311 RepID=A0A0I9U2W2_9MYCO|nr:DUF4157 domain-containing protein [Mycobacterium haemophilum]KLO32050.1 hypothetical protein ABH39_08715 [Mycobacterium haemophilum]KLO36401.1 hypothetical protein ABH38_12635 [Mycobacterium haemophilum]KLO42286.1 hypothetical protein ABH37_11265 [Mycobacterium haemophilum]KLO50087.1 hypothetical protein ABH36_09185 [Mycobacterium haemophilum]